MADENTITNEVKEETPEWVKQLQETLADLPSRLKEVLTSETPQEAPPANQPVEIVLPQPPEQETPQPEEVPEETPEQEKPKKRKLLDWLL